MNKLDLFVCENYLPEFQICAEQEGYEDVSVRAFPCMCENKSMITQTADLFESSQHSGNDILVHCGAYCDAIPLIPSGKRNNAYKSTYCSGHLASQGILDYIFEKRGFIVGSGWLKNWRRHLTNQGFDQQTAKQFYSEICDEFVFFQSDAYPEAECELSDLSHYLEIPYYIIPIDLEQTKYLLRAIVYEWKLHTKGDEWSEFRVQMQARSAEYSTVLDLLGKLSTFNNKRDAIGKIKEIFLMVMGAQEFRYCSADQEGLHESAESEEVECNGEITYKLSKEKNKFCIKIKHNEKEYGCLHVGGFLFPQHIEQYLNFAIEIARICGLVLSNIEQYETIIRSEKAYAYLSYHDALTGLSNRAFVNSVLNEYQSVPSVVVFSFDIDGLKHTNDTYGHAEGDKLICNFANVLKKCFRDGDVIARMGGDEFIAIAPYCDSLAAELIEQRIREAIRVFNANKEEPHVNIGVSLGFAVSTNNQYTLEELMKAADVLMYAEKKSKRD